MKKKLSYRIDAPVSCGTLTAHPNMRVAIGEVKLREMRLRLYLLVDEEDGIVADCKFQAYGPPLLVGAAEIACELILRKSYEQARKVSAELLDRTVRDRPDVPAFPKEAGSLLNLVLEAIDEAAAECMDIPLSEKDFITPFEADEIEGEGIPGFRDFPQQEKLAIITKVLTEEVQPYIALDSGGVRVVELKENGELHIAYEGSCTTCHSSTGSTLSAIQSVLRAKVDRGLIVVPVLNSTNAAVPTL